MLSPKPGMNHVKAKTHCAQRNKAGQNIVGCFDSSDSVRSFLDVKNFIQLAEARSEEDEEARGNFTRQPIFYISNKRENDKKYVYFR